LPLLFLIFSYFPGLFFTVCINIRWALYYAHYKMLCKITKKNSHNQKKVMFFCFLAVFLNGNTYLA